MAYILNGAECLCLRWGKRDERITCIFELLCDLGDIPMEIETKITEENDMELLSKWFRIAAKSDSIEQFIMKM